MPKARGSDGDIESASLKYLYHLPASPKAAQILCLPAVNASVFPHSYPRSDPRHHAHRDRMSIGSITLTHPSHFAHHIESTQRSICLFLQNQAESSLIWYLS